MTAKQAARELIDRLPDNVSWSDLMYELYAKEKIEEGLKDIAEGRTFSDEEVERRLLNQ